MSDKVVAGGAVIGLAKVCLIQERNLKAPQPQLFDPETWGVWNLGPWSRTRRHFLIELIL